jgi:signal transduction histidine kinase
MALYRIAQESLNNMVKHSQATEANLQLCRERGRITLSLQDNGVGFEMERATATSMGLRIMRERAEEIGATLIIESSPNSGTSIRVVLSEEILPVS